MFNCYLCDKSFVNNRSLINHVRQSHKNLSEEDFYKYTNRGIKSNCLKCNKEEYLFKLKEGFCEDCYNQTHVICPICQKSVHSSLKQHVNRSHKNLSKDDYYNVIGRTSKGFCEICGKEEYIDEMGTQKVCKNCKEKYSVSCPDCGERLLWRVAFHYTKVHPHKNLPENLGELKVVKCKSCGKTIKVVRVLYGERERNILEYCEECSKKLITCPLCNKTIIPSLNFYRHLVYCSKTNNIQDIENYVQNIEDKVIKQRILDDYNKVVSIVEFESLEDAINRKLKQKNRGKLPSGGWRYNYTYSQEDLDKIRSLQLEHKRLKYGGYCCSEEKRAEISQRMKTNNPMFKENVKQKRNATCLEHYGVDNVMKVPDIRIKSHTNGNRFNSYSKISFKFFEELDKQLNLSNSYYGNKEWFIRLDKNNSLNQDIIFVDYYNKDIDLVIEFYGDYWHGNPKLYNPDDMIRNNKVSNIWEHDNLKKNLIIAHLKPKHFYEVWESDFDVMMEVIINDIINERNLG